MATCSWARLIAVATLAATILVTIDGSPAAADTNACSNPVLASDLNDWGSLDGASVSRDPVGEPIGASWAFDTGGREFYMPSLSVTPGQSWTVSAKDAVVFGSGSAKIAVDWFSSTGDYLGEQQAPSVTLPASTASAGTWVLVSATFTVPSGAAFAHVLQIGDFGSATGTDFKATVCNYQLATTSPSDSAAVRYGWGSAVAGQSDEYNATSVDLAKWGLFGADPGQRTGCTPGFNGHGRRCAAQTTESGGFLSVSGTADGVTGGLYARTRPFKYGRIEVRERAVQLSMSGGRYGAVPLLWPADDNNWQSAEIDFAERPVGDPEIDLFVHHDGTQTYCPLAIDSTQFHNYAIDWQPNSVTWYVDGNLVCTVNAAVPYFNVTNGGAQLDMIPATGPMRAARQDIDWIRMYQNSHTQYQ
ncbi:glycoside hydrolase family 16 protein [Sphaerisporangium sp. NPDC005289]|uniref:glycoside hydrolase family 16 protein n=1 Tax=Sphaerisporangium sp. NPDC005289 TaxID=3155247 RepID=UPI0033A45066